MSSLRTVNTALAKQKSAALKQLTVRDLEEDLIVSIKCDYTVKYGSLSAERKNVFNSIKANVEKFPFTELKPEFDAVGMKNGVNYTENVGKVFDALKLLFIEGSYSYKSANCPDTNFLYYRDYLNLDTYVKGKPYSSHAFAKTLLILDASLAMYIQKKTLTNIMKNKDFEKDTMKEMYTISERKENVSQLKTFKKTVTVTDNLFTTEGKSKGGSRTRMRDIGQTIIYLFDCLALDEYFSMEFRMGMAPFLKGKFFPESVVKGPTFFLIDLYQDPTSNFFIGNWTFSKGQVSFSLSRKIPDIMKNGLKGKMITFASQVTASDYAAVKSTVDQHNVIYENSLKKRQMEKIIKEKKGKPKMEEIKEEPKAEKRFRFVNPAEILTLTTQKVEEINASNKYSDKQKRQIQDNLAKINKTVAGSPLSKFGLDWLAFLGEYGIEPEIEYVV